MSKLSNAIGALRAGLVEAVNASGLPPCVVGMVLDQVRTQVRLLEAQEDAEAEEKKGGRQWRFTECRVTERLRWACRWATRL